MPNKTSVFTKNFRQAVKALNYMTQPKGTSIDEISRELRITRRSVFRLLNVIEQELHIPIIVRREGFGAKASYKIDPAFIKSISKIMIPEPLTINQMLILHVVINCQELYS